MFLILPFWPAEWFTIWSFIGEKKKKKKDMLTLDLEKANNKTKQY